MRNVTEPAAIAVAVCLACVATFGPKQPAQAQTPTTGKAPAGKGLLGSPGFRPSAERPVGWRGDGTGRFPGATPPTDFGRALKGAGDYETKNVKWMTRMPSYSIGSPVIVGDKVFVATEMTGVVCLNKADGKILWVRHNTYIDSATAEEKQAAPEAAHEAQALAAQLDKATEELIGLLNAGISPRGMTATQVKATDGKCEEYLKLERKLVDAGMKVKGLRNLPDKQHCGWTSGTACSDGQRLYVQHGTGVFAAYDLDGKLIWSHAEKCGWEHGNHESPALAGDTLLVHVIAPKAEVEAPTPEAAAAAATATPAEPEVIKKGKAEKGEEEAPAEETKKEKK